MTFSWYGFIVGMAFAVLCLGVEKILSSRRTYKLEWLALWIAVPAVMGARFYHLATDWHLYVDEPLWKLAAVWEGGLGIYGAIVGGLIGVLLWRFWSRSAVSILELADAFALTLPWAQAIGRWGNYVNQELYGTATTLPWGIRLDSDHLPINISPSTRFHPLFLYEALGSLILGGVLFFVHRRWKVGTGISAAVYLIGYGMLRYMLEFLRFESAAGPFGLTIAQWMSSLAISAGVLLLVATHRRSLQ